jgi:hypothetical protein
MAPGASIPDLFRRGTAYIDLRLTLVTTIARAAKNITEVDIQPMTRSPSLTRNFLIITGTATTPLITALQ